MDQIAGFERYLSVTEENRLEVLHPPEKTPELFERFLPYAIALGVENKWADKFAVGARRGRGRSEPAGRHVYGLVCRQPDALDQPRPLRRRTMGGALASSVASAATAPGSSSGSGGGGFSGGGGGGGGGGGW